MTYTLLPLERRPRTPEPQIVTLAGVELLRAEYEVELHVESLEDGAPLTLEVTAGGVAVGRGAWAPLATFEVSEPGRYVGRGDVEPLLECHLGNYYARCRVRWECAGPTRFGMTARPLGATQ